VEFFANAGQTAGAASDKNIAGIGLYTLVSAGLFWFVSALMFSQQKGHPEVAFGRYS